MKPPPQLKKQGRAFWKRIVDQYDLGPDHEQALLRTCETIDRLEECRTIIERDGGVIISNRYGDPKINPAADLEHRLRAQLRGYLDALKLDEEDTEPVRYSAAKLAQARWNR